MAAFLAVGLVTGPVSAQKAHDRARAAVKAGKILPLRAVLKEVQEGYPGKVVDADVKEVPMPGTGNLRWIYFLKILDERGRVTDLEVDARTARVISATAGGKHVPPVRRNRG